MKRFVRPWRWLSILFLLLVTVATPAATAQDDQVGVVAVSEPGIKTSAPLGEIFSGSGTPQDGRRFAGHASAYQPTGAEGQTSDGRYRMSRRSGKRCDRQSRWFGADGGPRDRCAGIDATITLPNGRQVKAKTKGLNHLLDSGLLEITEPGDWSYLDLGQSSSLHRGQWVMAIGHPGGYQEQRGTVVRIGRLLAVASRVLSSDCTLVGGDSGGPLVDMDGEVIGIHSRIGMALTQNFHVPVDVFTEQWDKLENGEEIGQSRMQIWLGFTLKDGTMEVVDVAADGPAQQAGMKIGDVIISIDSNPVANRDELWMQVRKLRVGQSISLTVKRESKEVELKLTAEPSR